MKLSIQSDQTKGVRKKLELVEKQARNFTVLEFNFIK